MKWTGSQDSGLTPSGVSVMMTSDPAAEVTTPGCWALWDQPIGGRQKPSASTGAHDGGQLG